MITRERAQEILKDVEVKMQSIFDDESNEYSYQEDFWDIWAKIMKQYYPEINMDDVQIEGYKYRTPYGYYFRLEDIEGEN